MRMTIIFTLAPVFIEAEGAWSVNSLLRTSPKAEVLVKVRRLG
jgi:hypothetical protein